MRLVVSGHAANSQVIRSIVAALTARGASLSSNGEARDDERAPSDRATHATQTIAIEDGHPQAMVYLDPLVSGAPVALSAIASLKEAASASRIDRLIVLLPAGPEGLTTVGEGALQALHSADIRTELLLVPGAIITALAAASPSSRTTDDAGSIAEAIEQLVFCEGHETFHIVANARTTQRHSGMVKRLIDIVLSVGVVMALWWLMLVVWALVRLQSPGPGIFAQQRVGHGGRVFTCYKFRTMHAATPNLGTHEVSLDAVTPLGHLLRRTKIDELPQVLNVLKGEMSFVGPRPCLPTQTALVERRRQRGIFEIVPGITGLAQVAKVDMSDPARLADWDYRYLKLQSLPMDLAILWRTLLGHGGGDRTGKHKV